MKATNDNDAVLINRGQPQTYQVMLCCNDERGMFEGRVRAVEIADEIRVVCRSDRGLAISFPIERRGQRYVKVGRRKFQRHAHRSCVGNLFWDLVSMHRQDARALVAYLLEHGWVVEEWSEGPFADLVPGKARAS